ncbi:PIN domain-containing protein [Desulfonatronum parangueonense]
MLFDTDVLIWVQRGNLGALELVENCKHPAISIYTYMELLQCARNKVQHGIIRAFIRDAGIRILPLNDAIGQRAAIYVERHGLADGLRAGDAIIAATAMEFGLVLCSANRKHFQAIPELDLRVFQVDGDNPGS